MTHISLSLKNLIRTPGKTILFFLLAAASCALIVLGSVLLYSTDQRLEYAGNNFKTLVTVKQKPTYYSVQMRSNSCMGRTGIHEYMEYIRFLQASDLLFEDAEYIVPPEERPYYLSCLPQLDRTTEPQRRPHIVEFTPLEYSEDIQPVKARIERVLYSDPTEQQLDPPDPRLIEKKLCEGDIVKICQHTIEKKAKPFELGKTYIGNLWLSGWCDVHNAAEYSIHPGPFPSQMNMDGSAVNSEYFADRLLNGRLYCEEVTPGFYDEGGPGQDWLTKAGVFEDYRDKLFFVLPTNSLAVLPSVMQQAIYLQSGREITEEEFASGARVCMLRRETAIRNGLMIGDTIELPLLCSLYGYAGEFDNFTEFSTDTVSLVNAQGKICEPFWTAEYELVGLYDTVVEDSFGAGEIAPDMFIIPARSVEASDADNVAWRQAMNELTASFQLPNGTIESFDRIARENLPDYDMIEFNYSDGGYSKIAAQLNKSRNTALLLFSAGILSTITVISLLMYYFVVKERKRTALERGLGCTKNQCQVSIISGLLILTLGAAVIGSGISAIAAEAMIGASTAGSETAEAVSEIDGFSLEYSDWAKEKVSIEDFERSVDFSTPWQFYLLVPLGYSLSVGLLAMWVIERNLKVDPIYLLGIRGEHG